VIGIPPDRRGLRVSLVAGAGYDLFLGAFIFLAGRWAMEALGHPVGDPGFYFLLAGLPLLILPVLYMTAARSAAIGAFRPAVLWARGGGGLLIVLLTLWLRPGVAWLFFGIGLLDLAWALLHRTLWRSPKH
jgi:hypothetical protein